MDEHRSFIPLLIVIFLAFLVPLLLARFRKVRLPVVVGEILAGILVGRSGLGLVQQHDPVLDLLSEFGFAFLFFLAGTEIDFSAFTRKAAPTPKKLPAWAEPLPLAIIVFSLTLLLSSLAGWGMFQAGLTKNAWIMSLVFAPSSLGIIMAVLKESGIGRTAFGQEILASAIVADFGTLLLFTVSVAIFSRGLTLDILLIGVLFLAFFIIYRSGDVFFNRIPGVRRAMEEFSSATSQIKMRAGFTMLLIFVALSQMIGAEIVLGAFLGGVVISLLATPSDQDALHQLEAVGFGFFIPIFFIMIGVDFEIQSLLESPPVPVLNVPQAVLYVPVILLITLAVKFLPALLFKIKYGWRETFAIGTLLSARLSLIVAEAAIVLGLGLIDSSVNAAVILTAMLLATFTPMIFIRLAPKPDEKEEHLVVITGAGELALQVAGQMLGHRERVILIDPDEERIQRAQKRGIQAVQACVDQQDEKISAILQSAKILINTYSDVELSYRICSLARSVYNIEHVVTRVNSPGEIARFEQLGVAAMNAAMDQASLIVLLARNPAIYELLTRTDDDKIVQEISITNPEYLHRTLRSIRLPGDVLILAVRRNGDLIVPRGNTELEYGDHLTIMGSQEAVAELLP